MLTFQDFSPSNPHLNSLLCLNIFLLLLYLRNICDLAQKINLSPSLFRVSCLDLDSNMNVNDFFRKKFKVLYNIPHAKDLSLYQKKPVESTWEGGFFRELWLEISRYFPNDRSSFVFLKVFLQSLHQRWRSHRGSLRIGGNEFKETFLENTHI